MCAHLTHAVLVLLGFAQDKKISLLTAHQWDFYTLVFHLLLKICTLEQMKRDGKCEMEKQMKKK